MTTLTVLMASWISHSAIMSTYQLEVTSSCRNMLIGITTAACSTTRRETKFIMRIPIADSFGSHNVFLLLPTRTSNQFFKMLTTLCKQTIRNTLKNGEILNLEHLRLIMATWESSLHF